MGIPRGIAIPTAESRAAIPIPMGISIPTAYLL